MISNIDSKPKDGLMEITGTKGTYLMGWDNYKIYEHGEGKIVTTQYPHVKDQPQSYYDNVRDHLVEAKALVITPEWSRRPIHILDLAANSARLGRSLPAQHS